MQGSFLLPFSPSFWAWLDGRPGPRPVCGLSTAPGAAAPRSRPRDAGAPSDPDPDPVGLRTKAFARRGAANQSNMRFLFFHL